MGRFTFMLVLGTCVVVVGVIAFALVSVLIRGFSSGSSEHSHPHPH